MLSSNQLQHFIYKGQFRAIYQVSIIIKKALRVRIYIKGGITLINTIGRGGGLFKGVKNPPKGVVIIGGGITLTSIIGRSGGLFKGD